MSQRASGYERKPDESYETIAWPVIALLSQLPRVRRAWDPCDRGSGRLVKTLRDYGVEAVGTDKDFLTTTEAPLHVSDLITNPPYGENRRGELAVAFIEHALTFASWTCCPAFGARHATPHSTIERVAMLLRNDFDSAISRQHLFRDNPLFAGKIVLLNRIKWFVGASSPSDNHSWFLWDRNHRGEPSIRYITRAEAEERAS
jgi:hypothetical protein